MLAQIGSGVAILTASLAGSIHCVGMCGGLMVSATGSRLSNQIAYHLSRGLAYTLAGAAVGAIGQLPLLNLVLVPLQIFFTVVVASLLIAIGIQIWLQGSSDFGTGFFKRLGMSRIAEGGIRWGKKQSQMVRASSIGFFTVFLPCGWLLGFLLLAMASHQVWTGAGVMLMFWLGTVPLLASSRVLVQSLAAKIESKTSRHFAQRWIAIGMIVAGLISVYQHAIRLSLQSGMSDSSVTCHQGTKI